MKRLLVLALLVALVPAPASRFRVVGGRMYVGSRPSTKDLRDLAALGVTLVVSVDGSRPDLEAAHGAGLRYAHVPLEYSGIREEQALALAREVRDADGRVYIHCHHGTQRGPAAAAAVARILDGSSAADAAATMKSFGGDPKYAGLFASVASLERRDPGEGPRAPEIATPSSVVGIMVDLEDRLDRLKKGKPREGDAAHEALLVREGLVELGRLASYPELAPAIEAARALEAAGGRGPALERLARSCTDCHVRHRDLPLDQR